MQLPGKLCIPESAAQSFIRGLDHWPTWNKLKYSWKPMSFVHFNIWVILHWSGPENPQKPLPL